jgi:hypothetical protein
MNSLDRVTAGVTEISTIPDSVSRLLDNVAGEIRLAAGNPDASNALADLLSSEAGRLGLHVMAHTPMILATPPVHPEPTDDTAETEQPDVVDPLPSDPLPANPAYSSEWAKTEQPDVVDPLPSDPLPANPAYSSEWAKNGMTQSEWDALSDDERAARRAPPA